VYPGEITASSDATAVFLDARFCPGKKRVEIISTPENVALRWLLETIKCFVLDKHERRSR
jgi:hypothetical protein